ncbi:MAG: hypothetical protein WDN69_12395 [Aliidongia sp.]
MLDQILTLIAPEGGAPLAPGLIAELRDTLYRLGAGGRAAGLAAAGSRLRPGLCRSQCRPGRCRGPPVARRSAGRCRGPAKAERRKRLLVADMESTLIRNEMLDELAEYVGLHAEIAAITRGR